MFLLYLLSPPLNIRFKFEDEHFMHVANNLRVKYEGKQTTVRQLDSKNTVQQILTKSPDFATTETLLLT